MTDQHNDNIDDAAPVAPDAPADEAGAEGAAGGDVVADEMARVAGERDEYLDQLQRTRADFDNYRKRVERERPLLQEAGIRDVVGELLPVLDNLERALDALVAAGDTAASDIASGVDMVRQQLAGLIAGRGAEEIVAEGQVFDPTVHEAVQSVPVPGQPAGTVVAVVQRGYRMSDNVIRPARVVVAEGDGGVS